MFTTDKTKTKKTPAQKTSYNTHRPNDRIKTFHLQRLISLFYYRYLGFLADMLLEEYVYQGSRE